MPSSQFFDSRTLDLAVSSCPNGLKCLHLNIRSLKRHFTEFEHFIASFKFIFHIIVITESWLSYDGYECYSFKNYSHYAFCRQLGKSGGGVSIFVFDAMFSSSIKMSLQTYSSFEYICVKLTLNNSSLFIVGLYRPPNLNVTQFHSDCEKLLAELGAFNSDKIILSLIMGDFNLDISVNCSFKFLCKSYGYHALIHGTTRDSGSGGSCIDNILINDFPSMSTAGIIMDHISDHYPIFCFLDIGKDPTNSHPIYAKDEVSLNYKLFLKKYAQHVPNLNSFWSTSLDNDSSLI